jgi:D-3-phosphoglycerate dehydrogenase
MYKVLNLFTVETETARSDLASMQDIVEITTLPNDRVTVLKAIKEFDACIPALSIRVDREFIDNAVNLKGIFTPSTGLDHIDLEYAKEKNVKVFGMKNDREFLDNVTATAECALGLLLGVVRKLPWGFAAALNGNWARDRYRGHQLSGKTMGILGYGRLGSIMADYAKALRMDVIACDIKKIDNPAIRQVTFSELLNRSDVISIHIHLNQENRHLINSSAFAAMKPGVVIINTSRGAIIDETAFIEALENGRVSAAGLDVIDGEWLEDTTRHPLIQYAAKHENLLISPHVGGVTFESQEMSLAHTLKKVRAFFANGCRVENDQMLVNSLMNPSIHYIIQS